MEQKLEVDKIGHLDYYRYSLEGSWQGLLGDKERGHSEDNSLVLTNNGKITLI